MEKELTTGLRLKTQDDEVTQLRNELLDNAKQIVVVEQEKQRLMSEVAALQDEKTSISQMFKAKSEEYEEF